MTRHYKKLSEETLHENPWCKFKKDVFQFGERSDREYYYVETRGFVMIIPITIDGKIVLTLQHRYLRDKESIEFPGGGMTPGESAANCAMMELQQETGWKADELIKIGEFEPSNGTLKESAHIFIAEVSEQISQNLDDTEDIEVLYRTPEEITEMISRNDIWCGHTLAAWALANNYFRSKTSSNAEAPGLKILFDYFVGK
jgi:ADP-ribose pyrophosphatase